MDKRVRRATAADQDALALIGATTFLTTYADVLPGDAIIAHCAREHCAARYAALLEDGAAAWLAEAEQGAPIGYAVIAPPDMPLAEAGDLDLKRIYLLPAAQGRGIADVLMDQTITEARARGAGRLLVGLYEGNLRAMRFYQRIGFTLVGRRSFTVGSSQFDDPVLALRL